MEREREREMEETVGRRNELNGGKGKSGREEFDGGI